MPAPPRFDVHIFILHSRSPGDLEKSLSSIRRQSFNGSLRLTVLGNAPVALNIENADYVVDPAAHGSTSKAGLLLRKRQWCIANAKADLVCFLDDDNWWDRDHLQSLFNALGQGDAWAAYGWRTLWDQRGAPYVTPGDPWARRSSQRAGSHLYDLGIRRRGSNQFHDVLYEAPIEGYYGCIDLGSWLGSVAFWRRFMFHNLDADYGEDDMICKMVWDAEIAIAATRRATLNYTIRDDHSYA